jgi:hypothetical protein
MKHKGMYLRTKSGNIAHVLADPKMSIETQTMLSKLIDLAYNYCDEKK